jgi:ribosomal-protein-alanine N-acetyltransferase
VQLSTARLRLRGLRSSDAPFVLTLMNEPSFIEFIGDRKVRTVAQAERYISEGPWTRPGAPGGGFNAVEISDTGEPIGICGLLKRESLPDPDIGFAFLRAHWSRGYAFEAAAAVRDHARDVLRLPRLLAITNLKNTSSRRLLERLGFGYVRVTTPSDGTPGLALYAATLDTIPPP